MKKRMRFLRQDLLGKVAKVTLGAAALAGCSSATERFGPNDIYTASTANQKEILTGSAPVQPSYQDIINGTGGTTAGLPQNTSAPVSTGSIPRQPAPVTSPAVVSAPIAPSITSAQVPSVPAPETLAAGKDWKGWTAAGGTQIKARQGDTLASISRRYGVPIQAVASVNGLQSRSSVQAGQSLIIPTYVYSDRNGSTSTTDGETRAVQLPTVSRNENVVTGSIPNVSRAAPRPDRKPYAQPTFAQVTQSTPAIVATPVVPISALPKSKPQGVSAPIVTASVPQTVASGGASVPSPKRQPDRIVSTNRSDDSIQVETTPIAAPDSSADAPVKTEAAPEKPIEVASIQPQADEPVAKFRWPVRGRIISDFGAKPGGGRNEGVNLAVPEGTPVKAAGDGTVIYAGNELKGYGNLVLVRHDEGWVSAYAHNSVLNVKRGDTVRRGDPVALAGATGSVNQPQVHFELRQGNKPVDPLKYLPRR